MLAGAARLEQGRFGRALWLIVGAACELRLAVRWLHGTANYWAKGYGFCFAIARNLAQGRGYELLADKLIVSRTRLSLVPARGDRQGVAPVSELRARAC